MEIIIGSDHGGFKLKESIKRYLSEEMDITPFDAGTFSPESVDYPDIGAMVSKRVQNGEFKRGILVCGTGIGMSIVANKFPGIRAALCHDIFTARMSREHNDSNIFVVGERVTNNDPPEDMIKVWLTSEFQGGRHQRRLDIITDTEKGICDSQGRRSKSTGAVES